MSNKTRKAKEIPGLVYIILPLAIIAGVMFLLKEKDPDINFCRKVFNGLVSNSYPAERFIDWKNLKVIDVDVGANYSGLPNEKQRTEYRKSFFAGFSLGFKQLKGSREAFTNWRIHKKDSDKVVVAADYPLYNKTILFGISKSPKPLLISIQWE
jgi:hypothetical protein